MIIDQATSSLIGVHPETVQHLSGGHGSQHGEVSSVEWNFLYSKTTSSDKQVASVSIICTPSPQTHTAFSLVWREVDTKDPGIWGAIQGYVVDGNGDTQVE